MALMIEELFRVCLLCSGGASAFCDGDGGGGGRRGVVPPGVAGKTASVDCEMKTMSGGYVLTCWTAQIS